MFIVSISEGCVVMQNRDKYTKFLQFSGTDHYAMSTGKVIVTMIFFVIAYPLLLFEQRKMRIDVLQSVQYRQRH